MGARRILLLLGLGLSAPGCTLFETAVRNLVQAPADCIDDHRTRARAAELAEEAWGSYYAEHPAAYTPDFERGFREGFAEFLYGGDPGVPPAVPPKDYQRPRYMTPEGHQAILDWYAGWTKGVAAGKASGLRQLMMIPSSGAIIDLPPSRLGPPPLPGPPVPLVPPPQPEQDLTPPRPLPPQADSPAPPGPPAGKAPEVGPPVSQAPEASPPAAPGGYVSWRPVPVRVSRGSSAEPRPAAEQR